MSQLRSAATKSSFADFTKPSSLPPTPPYGVDSLQNEKQPAVAPLDVEAALRGDARRDAWGPTVP